MNNPVLKYRADIDGLRAVAVLLVVGFHAFPGKIASGFMGVDVFFVISGFLISLIIFSSQERGGFNIVEFYIRRILRIFPALCLVMLSCVVVGWFILLPDELAQLGKHVAGGASFISNFLLLSESGYFDSAAESKVLLHLWSLAVEEQFYIFWPLLFLFCWNNKWSFLKVALVVWVFSFCANLYLLGGNPSAAFYSPVSRFWELLLGGLLAHVSLFRAELLGRYRNAQSVFGVLLLFMAVVYIDKTREFPGWWALLPTFGAFFIISAGPSAWVNRNILSNKYLVWIGLVSYPLYLWHWPILSLVNIVESGSPSRQLKLVGVLFAFMLAFLTYRFVEKPIRSNGAGVKKAVALVALIALIGVVGFVFYRQEGFVNRVEVPYNSEALKQFGDYPLDYINNKNCVSRFGYDVPGNANHWFCVLSKDESPSLLLLGNSFANHHYPGFSKNPALMHHSILSIGICDAADPADEGERDFVRDKYSACNKGNKLKEQALIDSIVKEVKTIKFTIIDGLRRDPDDKYIERLLRRVDFLQSNNIKVIIFLPHLLHYANIKNCIPRPFREAVNCDFSVDERVELNRSFRPLVEKISAMNKNVLFFDPNNLFCDEIKCSLLRNGMPLSRDLTQDEHGGHLSLYASDELTKLFVEWANKHLPDLLQSQGF